MSAIIITTSLPVDFDTEKLIAGLLEKRLAACIQISDKITSHYRWQGKIEQADEKIMQIKTCRNQYAAIEQEILKQHPYELPEIISVNIEQGLTPYLDWINNQVTHKTQC